MPRICQLYRHFDKNGVLLYVGVSFNSKLRLKEHRYSSLWYRQVASITVENFDNREQALAAELKAIVKEKPLWNKIGNRSDAAAAWLAENDVSIFKRHGKVVPVMFSRKKGYKITG